MPINQMKGTIFNQLIREGFMENQFIIVPLCILLYTLGSCFYSLVRVPEQIQYAGI